MLDTTSFISSLSVLQMRDELLRLRNSLQSMMRKHECQQLKLSRSDLGHLHRAILEADARHEWLAAAVENGHGEELFFNYCSRQT